MEGFIPPFMTEDDIMEHISRIIMIHNFSLR